MGHGGSDFGAWEKHAFGWLDRIAEPEPRLAIGAIDRASTLPQALRAVVAGDEYWLEYRPPEPLWEYADDGTAGVAIHAGSNGLGEPSRYSGRNFLLYDPVGRGRPSVQAGETFLVRGAFAVTVVAARPDSAEVAFRWTDRTRPGRPAILASRPRRGRAVIRWRRGIERGSGIAAHEVFVDGRRAGRVAAVGTIGSILVAADDRLCGPASAGPPPHRDCRDRPGREPKPARGSHRQRSTLVIPGRQSSRFSPCGSRERSGSRLHQRRSTGR